MPAFLTHFYILDLATGKSGGNAARTSLEGTAPLYDPPGPGRRISQFGYFGAMGPDWAAYYQDGLRQELKGQGVQQTIFDMIHRKKSSVVVMNLLDEIRGKSGTGPDAIKAFVFGYLAHIAADIIVHPYVNSFAGEYHQQPIPNVFEALMPSGPVAMHMFNEVHMDAYLATKHYGAGDQLSNGPGNQTLSSWSDFYNDLVTAGFLGAGHNPVGGMVDVLKGYVKVLNLTYPGMNLKEDDLNTALGRIFDALDVGYDTAGMHEVLITPPVDWWNLDFVQHRYYRNDWRRMEDLCDSAAWLAANKFWPAAITYLESGGTQDDRKAFLKEVRDWNLDTGFTVRVYSKEDTIYIRYDHSWALFLSEAALPRSIDTMNAELMADCHKAAQVSGDFHQNVQPVSLPQGGDSSWTRQHDDVDYGMARVKCTSGQVTVDTNARIWWDWGDFHEQRTVKAGQDAIFELKTQDDTKDQDNRLRITAAGSAQCEVDFVSWDR